MKKQGTLTVEMRDLSKEQQRKKRLRIDLNQKLHKRVRKAALKKGQTIRKYLDICVLEKLKRDEAPDQHKQRWIDKMLCKLSGFYN